MGLASSFASSFRLYHNCIPSTIRRISAHPDVTPNPIAAPFSVLQLAAASVGFVEGGVDVVEGSLEEAAAVAVIVVVVVTMVEQSMSSLLPI